MSDLSELDLGSKRLRPYQCNLIEKVRDEIRKGRRRIIINAPTGSGKCLGRGTPVILFDGTVKAVENVIVGDLLMGPDSKPRRVLSTCTGSEMLYRVTPVKGDSYVVNESHVLSLQRTAESDNKQRRQRNRVGELANVSVKDYLSWTKWKRHLYKGWRAGVDFESTEVLPINPYFLGLWLGDGTQATTAVTTGDLEIVGWLGEFAKTYNLYLRVEENSEGSVIVFLTSGIKGNRQQNPLILQMRTMGLLRQKHIPHCYKTASRQDRLRLLAGILDTDGYYERGTYDLTLKSESLLDDVIFVVRSLGLAAYKKECLKTCCNNGKTGTYFRCSISGDLSQIPCLVERKKASPRLQKKSVLRTGIKVGPVGKGDYFGFEIDGDGLFLLGDFTVTHNTTVTCGIIKLSAMKGSLSMFMAPRRELLRQTADHLIDCDVKYSFIAAGMGEQMAGSECLVVSKDTLHSRAMRRSKIPIPTTNVLAIDECVSGDTLIHTNLGQIPIQDAIDAKFVLSYNGTRPCWRKILRFLPRGRRKTITVKTSSGLELKCTPEHPVATDRGWVQASRLHLGQKVLFAHVDVEKQSLPTGTQLCNGGGCLPVDTESLLRQSGPETNGSKSSMSSMQTDLHASVAVGSKSKRFPWTPLLEAGMRSFQSTSGGTIAATPCFHLPKTNGLRYLEPCLVTPQSTTRTLSACRHGSMAITPSNKRHGSGIRRNSCRDFKPASQSHQIKDTERLFAVGERDCNHAFGRSMTLLLRTAKSGLPQNGSIASAKLDWLGGFVMMEARPMGLQSHSTQRAIPEKNLRSSLHGSGMDGLSTPLYKRQENTFESECRTQCPSELLHTAGLRFQSVCDIKWTSVVEICDVGEECDVFDLEVEGDHCYWTNGILSHNCHLSLAPRFMALMLEIEKQNPGMITLGLSATPGRADGKGLGDFWESIVTAAGYEELRELGFLVPARVFLGHAPDMKGVRSVDWDSEAAKRVDKPKLVGDIVENWLRYASDRKTFVFGATQSHAIHLRDEFLKAGIRAAHVDDTTPPDERAQAFDDLRSGAIQVLTNVEIATYGIDIPEVSCVVLASPCRSLVRYRQRCGRVLRPFNGKKDALVLDHAGGVIMHGFPDEDIEWPLEKSRSIDQEYQKKRKEGGTKEPIICTTCGCAYSGMPVCPNCGSRQSRQGRAIAVERGLLKEIKREKKKPVVNSFEQKQKYWNQCLAVMARKGRTCGAAARMYSRAIGSPPWNTKGLQRVPKFGDWKKPVAEVYPNFAPKVSDELPR